MSIGAMADAALARRADFAPANRPPDGVGEIVTAVRGAAAPQSSTTNVLDLLATYIPSEVITLYIVLLGVTLGLVNDPAQTNLTILWRWTGTVMLLLATPLVVWLVFAAKLRAAGKPLPTAWATWPKWEMTAATVAFLIWAYAVPSNPFSTLWWYSPAIAGFMALLIQVFLGLLAPLFQEPLATQ